MSSKKKDIVLVQAEEWQGLYVNGKLEAEGHSLPGFIIMDAIGGFTRKPTPEQEKYLAIVGNLPKKL